MQPIVTESVSELTRKGACLAFFEAYADLDTARMINLATPDATVFFEPLGNDGRGSFWEFGRTVWQLLMDCFPNIDNTVDTMTADGDEVVCRVAIFGTQAQAFMGIPSKGLSFNSDHVFVFQFDEADRITHVSISWEHPRFVEQLTGA